MKVTTIIGARPQFIKAAAVSRELRAAPGVRESLVHTGQHYDENMSDIFFEELEIPRPDHHLGIGSGLHGAQTGRMLEAIEKVLMDERPDYLLVYGDTNSTLAGALAAAKQHIPVAHIEAGLRSFNRRMPEEINRVLTDHVSDLLFAPTAVAVRHLQAEGIPAGKVHQVGDVMYDAALFYSAKAEQVSRILAELEIAPKGYILSTIHRAENTDDPNRLQAIFGGLGQVAERIPVILPLHPRTRSLLERGSTGVIPSSRIRFIDPVGYLDMAMLEKNAALIATDSGGVQKEAFFYQTPCVTLRDETEWTELVELGWNRLCPPHSADRVAKAVLAGMGSEGEKAFPYGEGTTARHIVRVMASG